MLVNKIYDRSRAYRYARKWAFSRNPLFNDYSELGGNCTNFVSQCIYAGSCVMNFTPVLGWYFLSDTNRTASWTGVQFFYDFITKNQGVGPYGIESASDKLEVGDVIQLGRENEGYYHTLLVVGATDGVYTVSAQSKDAFDRPLNTYEYDFARYIHIEGVRIDVRGFEDCYDAVYNGTGIVINGSIPGTMNNSQNQMQESPGQIPQEAPLPNPEGNPSQSQPESPPPSPEGNPSQSQPESPPPSPEETPPQGPSESPPPSP
ncbi:MAG: amidase domain-containing protein [Eubacteriales bacterium]|nr:amidase domain-containing protein [Eubacteriales bacterium]